MGTHPIFESDFDCLTEGLKHIIMMLRQVTRIASRSVRLASEIPAGAMQFSFSSPSEQYYANALDVKQVDCPTGTGAIGILPNHVPSLGVLAPGVLTVFGEGGKAEKFFVSSGSYTINFDSSVSIIAEEACRLDELDKDAATKALQAAQSSAGSGDDVAKAEAEIEIQTLQAAIAALA